MKHSKHHIDILSALSNSPKQFLYHGSQCQDFRLLFSYAFTLLKSSCCILIICKPEKSEKFSGGENFTTSKNSTIFTKLLLNFFLIIFFFFATFVILCSFFGRIYVLFYFPNWVWLPPFGRVSFFEATLLFHLAVSLSCILFFL